MDKQLHEKFNRLLSVLEMDNIDSYDNYYYINYGSETMDRIYSLKIENGRFLGSSDFYKEANDNSSWFELTPEQIEEVYTQLS